MIVDLRLYAFIQNHDLNISLLRELQDILVKKEARYTNGLTNFSESLYCDLFLLYKGLLPVFPSEYVHKSPVTMPDNSKLMFA